MKTSMFQPRKVKQDFRCVELFMLLQIFDLFSCSSVAMADEAIVSRRVSLSDWKFDPALVMNVVLVLWLYARGLAKFRESSQRRFIYGGTHFFSFLIGLFILLGCLISPLDPLSSQLASAHMVQHMTIMTVAAPLVVLGSPGLLISLGLPPTGQFVLRRARQFLRSILGQPHKRLVGCWLIYASAVWAWHFPAFYDSAIRQPMIHDLQHLCFFLAALLFWQPIIDPLFRPKQNQGVAVFYLFTTTLHATILGVFMTVAPSAWYPHYERTTELWNLSALEDQQLAGLIMWMPACATYAFCAILIFSNAIGRKDNRSDQFAILESRRL